MTGCRFGPDFSSFNARVADYGEPALYVAGVVLRQVAGIAWCATALAFEDTPWATLADLPVHAATLRRAGRRGGWL